MNTVNGDPDLSIIIVNWNTRDLVLDCLQTLREGAAGLRTEVFVVDNGSVDGSVDAITAAFPHVRVIANSENKGLAAASNQACGLARARYALILNSDTRVPPGSLAELVRCGDRTPAAGVVGARILNPDGSFQASFEPFPTMWTEFVSASGAGRRLVCRSYPSRSEGRSLATRRVDVVAGCCLLLRTEAARAIGWLNEDYGMYCEEADLCLRMRRAGWTTWYCAEATIVHLGAQSTRQRRREMLVKLYSSKVLFFRRHRGSWQAAGLRLLYFLVLRARWAIRRLANQRVESPVAWTELEPR